MPKSQIAAQIAAKIKRTVESIRDRIKRYHNKLSAADRNLLQREAKKNANHYAYFVKAGENGEKKIEKISDQPPVL